MHAALVNISKARALLAKANTIDEVKDIRDKAEAVRLYFRQAGEGLEAQNAAAEIKIRAERRAGVLLAKMEKQSGARGVGKKVESHAATPLSEMGLDKFQSSRWQTEAIVPEKQFETFLAETRDAGKEITSAALYKLGRQQKAKKTNPVPPPIVHVEGLPLDKIIHGDNVQVLSEFPEESIHLVVTSPPYDDLRTYGGHDWDFEGVAAQLERVLRPGGVIVWVVADQTKDGSETGESFRQALHFKSLGLNLHDTMIYKTNKPPSSLARYQNCWEFMFVFSKGSPTVFNPLMEKCIWAGVGTSPRMRDKGGELQGKGRRIIKEQKVRSNIWHYDTGSGKDAQHGHPAPFPIGLAQEHIMSWSNEGAVVLDPFNGSGTTTKAALDLQRRYIGIDVNQEYCEAALKRLDLKQARLFGTETPA